MLFLMLWQGKKERKICKVTGNHEFKETVNKVVSEVSSFVGNPVEQESPPGEGGGGQQSTMKMRKM